MKAVGVNRVFYSVDGGVICERVNHMVSINASSITRHLEAKYYNTPSDKTEYYKMLLLRYMPKTINKTNLEYFIKYNFSDTLSNYTYKINNNKVIFYDENMNYVTKSILVS